MRQTEKALAGSGRQLMLTLADGTTHTDLCQFEQAGGAALLLPSEEGLALARPSSPFATPGAWQ